eukprot:8349896-Lingulodinium_polyedra.AAC.1
MELVVHEADIFRDATQDLLASDVQQEHIEAIQAGSYHVVFCTPPCGSWSRANWANSRGPRPCRSW